MRYHGQHIVMERGQHPSDGPRRIEVCEAATGAVLATFGPGYNPRWLNDDEIVAESPDGTASSEAIGWWSVLRVPANRGQVDANGHGTWAVSDLRLTTVHPSGAVVGREPRLSASGELAVRDPETGTLRIFGRADLGVCEDSRWSSETLVWWLGGRVWGRVTPDQPTVELCLAGRTLSHPAPFWHEEDASLWVALEIGEGELALCEWSDLTEGRAQGYPLGRSDGSGFDLDCAPGAVPHEIRVCYFDPVGQPVYVTVDTRQPPVSLRKPPAPEPPAPLPDVPWTTDPNGVVEDIWPWIANNATALSPDGRVAWILKSDEANFEGQTHGEHWDCDDRYIGHLEDSSTGYRWWPAGRKRVNAIDWVKLGEPEPWASLPLERNCFDAGARLWLPRRCVSGYRQKFVTNIRWSPSGYVQPNIPMETRVDVGYARFSGREAFVRGVYSSSGDGGRTFNDEVNYYGPSGWVTHTPAGSTT